MHYRREKSVAIDEIAAYLIAFVMVSSVFPPLRTMGKNTWLCILAIVGWTVLCLLQNPKYFLKIEISRFVTYVFIVYTILVPFLFQTNTLANRYAALILFPMGPIIFEYYMWKDKLYILQRISKVTMFFAAITFIKTFAALLQDTTISRSIKSSGEYSETIMRQGIGGYEFIYFICILIPVLLNGAIIEKGWRKLLFGISCCATIMIVVLSNYLTAVLITAIGIALLLYSCLKEKVAVQRKKTALFAIIALAIPAVFFNRKLGEVLAKGLSMLSLGGKNSQRLEEIQGSFILGIHQEFMNDRFPTLLQSFRSWFSNPFWGLVINKETVSGRYLQGVGQHSHVLDTFALFGTAIGIMNCWVLFGQFKKGKYFRKEMIPSFFVFAAILFLNNATPSLACAMYIIVPCINNYLENRRLENLNRS